MSAKTKCMRLFTSSWNNVETFKMLPITQEAPYAEVIYDPSTTLLVVVSKIQKHNFHFVPKLDDDGNIIPAKRANMNGRTYKEQRVVMPVLQEYYIEKREEQIQFIEEFASNSEYFDFKHYLRDLSQEKIMTPGKLDIVDGQGLPIK